MIEEKKQRSYILYIYILFLNLLLNVIFKWDITNVICREVFI